MSICKPRKVNRRLSASVSLSIIILVVGVSTTQLSTMTGVNDNSILANNVYAKYSSDQAQSLVNDCDIFDSDEVTTCQNNGPQTMADGTAPISIQNSNPGQPEPKDDTDGPQGPPQGPPGGPAGQLLVTQVVGNTVEVPPGEQRQSEAVCEPGEVATGGGFDLDAFTESNNQINPVVRSVGDGLSQPNGWIVEYFNPGPNAVSVQAFAECASLAP
jgi:hypothetical protein